MTSTKLAKNRSPAIGPADCVTRQAVVKVPKLYLSVFDTEDMRWRLSGKLLTPRNHSFLVLGIATISAWGVKKGTWETSQANETVRFACQKVRKQWINFAQSAGSFLKGTDKRGFFARCESSSPLPRRIVSLEANP